MSGRLDGVSCLAEQYPAEYRAGQATAARTIKTDPKRAPWSRRLAEAQLASWPALSGKNGLAEHQQARTQGFVDALVSMLDT